MQYTPPSVDYKNSSNVQPSGAFAFSGGGGGFHFQWALVSMKTPSVPGVHVALEAAGQVAIKGFQLSQLRGSAYMAFIENPVNGYRSTS